MNKEPALIIGLFGAIIALAVGFGAPISAEQVGLIMALVSAVLAVITRSVVTPAALVAAKEVDGKTVAGPAAIADDGTRVEVVQAL